MSSDIKIPQSLQSAETLAAAVQYDERTPVTAHPGLAAVMYGDIFRQADSVLNVAAGNTDLAADLERAGIVAPVTSLDPVYAFPTYSIRQERNRRVPGFAQAIPFEDDSFAMTLCQYGMQHLPKETAGNAIREMVRVTQRADDAYDSTKGAVFINPVFGSRQLERALSTHGVDKRAAWLLRHDPGKFRIAERHLVRPTLVIHKTEALTARQLDAIVAAIDETQALRPSHRTLGELVVRARGGRTGI